MRFHLDGQTNGGTSSEQGKRLAERTQKRGLQTAEAWDKNNDWFDRDVLELGTSLQPEGGLKAVLLGQGCAAPIITRHFS